MIIFRLVAHYGPVPAADGLDLPISRGCAGGRAIIDRQTIHIHDCRSEIETEFPGRVEPISTVTGTRTILVTPLLREGVPIGVIVIRRRRSVPLLISRSRFSKPSPIRP